MGNISCGLYTYVDPNILPTAKNVKENVRNVRNPQPTSSNPCGAPCQNNEASFQVQLSAEHEHNFIANTTQTQGVQAQTQGVQAKTRDGQTTQTQGVQAKTQGVQAKTRDGQTTQTQGVQAKTRDGQVDISRATLSSQTDNASSGHLYEGPGKTSQTEPELNSQPAQGLVRELEILKTQRLCKVCFSQNAGVTFAPCGHLASCVDCCSTVDRCPVCLSSIDGIVKTFFP
uniref:RING-type domain-containing protein n=1 Tax=Biomphalaria glabrata TaxID=6526 RepID=A0A2C9K0I7_BIOGL